MSGREHRLDPSPALDKPPEAMGETHDDVSVVRREEELVTDKALVDAGSVRVRKSADVLPVELAIERNTEHAEVERLAPEGGGSGQVETLADGSVSIPIFEEELVITKRLVVRERVIVRKRTVADEHLIEAELKRERADIDVDSNPQDVV